MNMPSSFALKRGDFGQLRNFDQPRKQWAGECEPRAISTSGQILDASVVATSRWLLK